jgi:hypothetical protein
VSLLRNDGTARSLKTGKVRRTITQLNAYREFGSPDVSLLDISLCEAGFLKQNRFPLPDLKTFISSKLTELRRQDFGYQLLPFEHGKDGDIDVGLFATASKRNPLKTTFDVIPATVSRAGQPFRKWADRIASFFERSPNRARKHFHQIVFCRACRRLQLIRMRDEYRCPGCGADLITQS